MCLTPDPFGYQASLESTEDLSFAIAHLGDWESLKFMPCTVSFTGYRLNRHVRNDFCVWISLVMLPDAFALYSKPNHQIANYLHSHLIVFLQRRLW